MDRNRMRTVRHGLEEPPCFHGTAHYAFFSAREVGISRPLAVYSGAEKKGPSSINSAEAIINAICDAENLNWRDVEWADLRTHKEYDVPRGYYHFELVRLKDEVRGNVHRKSPGCGWVEDWIPIECPATVFDVFKHVIGTFLSLEEVISSSRECYRDYTPAQMQDELEWAHGHARFINECIEKSMRSDGKKLVRIEDARKRGYRFDIHAGRHQCIPTELDDGTVVVDLKDSHLIGQHPLGHCPEPLCQPHRFSIWTRLCS